MHRSQAIVDLSAIKHNIAVVRQALPADTAIMAVVKANGYGHGLLAVANAALDAGATYLAVADVYEGSELRHRGVTAPILVMGGMLPSLAAITVENGMTQTVYSTEMVDALQAACTEQSRQVKIHVKVETGMNRLGVRPGGELDALLDAVAQSPDVRLEGLFSHFSVSEISDKSFTKAQYERFQQAVEQCAARGIHPICHISNSGAILDCPFATLDMVRLGIAMYGMYPDGGTVGELRPALSWKTNVVQVKTVEAGDTVSYGRIWTAESRRVIATLPVGYADGYRRLFGNRAEVLIHGRRVPVVGRVCMDHCMVDVTGIDGVAVGDEAVLIGRQGEETITTEELAACVDTINYEIITTIGERVKRVYRDE